MSALSDAKANLKAAQTAYAASISGGVAGYSRPGLSVTRLDPDKLLKAVQYWEAKVCELENGFYTTADLSGRASPMPEASVQE